MRILTGSGFRKGPGRLGRSERLIHGSGAYCLGSIEISKLAMMSDIVLYSRGGCHLCDVAAEILARHGLEFDRIDIDADSELRARYDTCVPVVVVDGRERFRGRVDELLLRRLLANRGQS